MRGAGDRGAEASRKRSSLPCSPLPFALTSNRLIIAGYTGTEVCVDPEREVLTILLTNRVYPKASDESEERIHHARQLFNNLVASLVDNKPSSGPRLR